MSTALAPGITPALESSGLACGHGVCSILENVDLSVPHGRFVCVIGANGTGKSTLVQTLAGLLPSMGGSIRIHGDRLGQMKPADRARQLSVVLTRLPSIGYLTVRRFVEIGRHPYTGSLGRLAETDHRAVDEAIRQVGIGHLSDRFLAAISDGERQRAAIARAFAQSASVMILDEPTAFLDVESRALVMTTLRNLAHSRARSVVATSHDIDLVLRIADEVWMITPDRQILTGAPEDLVLAGALDRVFPRHVMEFDVGTGGFRLPRPSGRRVVVSGTGIRSVWTAHAIERIGFEVVTDESEADDRADDLADVQGDAIARIDPGEKSSWSLTLQATAHDTASRVTREYESIAEVVDALRSVSPRTRSQ